MGSVAPTVHVVVQKTRPSRNSSSGTSWKLQLCEISQKPVFTMDTLSLSSTPNSHTASVVQSTPRLSGTGLVKIARSGPHLHDSGSDLVTTRNQQEDPVELHDPVAVVLEEPVREVHLELEDLEVVLLQLLPLQLLLVVESTSDDGLVVST